MSHDPPSDIEAERYILGAMMASPQAIAAAAEVLYPDQFYRPAHQVIYRAMVMMQAANERVDPVTLRAWLDRDGDTRVLGSKGAMYLAELYELPVNVMSVGHYADLILASALRRALIEEAHRIEMAGQQPSTDPGEILTRIDERMESIRRMGRPESSLMIGFDEASGKVAGDGHTVIPGLLDSEDRVVVVGGEGRGKALDVDTPVPTPKGWVTMGDLSPGDEVFTADGSVTRVTFTTPPMSGRPCFRVTFSDESEIIADGDHLWETETLRAREGREPLSIVTTTQVRDTLRARHGHCLNHAIATCGPLEYPAQELPVSPYLLGIWLGDGRSDSAVITTDDTEVLDEIRAEGYEISDAPGDMNYRVREPRPHCTRHPDRPVYSRGICKSCYQCAWESGGLRSYPISPVTTQGKLRAMGLLGNKHIPALYLTGSVGQRVSLMQGLMDSDGTADGTGRAEFSVTNRGLAEGFLELATGLGIKAVMREGRAALQGRDCGTRYRIAFYTDLPVFRLARKASVMPPMRTRRGVLRYIESVEPVESRPVRCIQVEHESALYLAGRACIATHNTTLAHQVAFAAACGCHPFCAREIPAQRVLIMDFENPRKLLGRRFDRLGETAARYRGWNPANIRFIERPGGVDLTRARDVFALTDAVRQFRPNLVIAGPIYKMIIGASTDDRGALAAHSRVAQFFDRLRERYGCAIWLEAHAPFGGAGHVREMRPEGSNLWAKWPEFGIALYKATKNHGGDTALDVKQFRGHREEGRMWPAWLTRNPNPSGWPWVGNYPQGTFTQQEEPGL